MTLARAQASGRLTLCCGAVVSHLQMAPGGDRAEGVVVVDAEGGSQHLLRAELGIVPVTEGPSSWYSHPSIQAALAP